MGLIRVPRQGPFGEASGECWISGSEWDSGTGTVLGNCNWLQNCSDTDLIRHLGRVPGGLSGSCANDGFGTPTDLVFREFFGVWEFKQGGDLVVKGCFASVEAWQRASQKLRGLGG